MLEFEVAVDKNIFIDLQKFPRTQTQDIVQASEADLKNDAGAAAVVTKTDGPYFCNVLYLLFSDCTVSAKFQMQMEIMSAKVSLKPNFLITKMQRLLGLVSQDFLYGDNPGAVTTAEINRRKALVRQSIEFMEKRKLAIDSFTCVRHLLSGVTLRILL